MLVADNHGWNSEELKNCEFIPKFKDRKEHVQQKTAHFLYLYLEITFLLRKFDICSRRIYSITELFDHMDQEEAQMAWKWKDEFEVACGTKQGKLHTAKENFYHVRKNKDC